MSLDPAFYELRTKPLPTMSERRRLVRERLAKERAALVELRTLGAEPRAILAKCDDVKLLRKALAYLGEPDRRCNCNCHSQGHDHREA